MKFNQVKTCSSGYVILDMCAIYRRQVNDSTISDTLCL